MKYNPNKTQSFYLIENVKYFLHIISLTMKYYESTSIFIFHLVSFFLELLTCLSSCDQ